MSGYSPAAIQDATAATAAVAAAAVAATAVATAIPLAYRFDIKLLYQVYVYALC